jgi:hypothetical protein
LIQETGYVHGRLVCGSRIYPRTEPPSALASISNTMCGKLRKPFGPTKSLLICDSIPTPCSFLLTLIPLPRPKIPFLGFRGTRSSCNISLDMATAMKTWIYHPDVESWNRSAARGYKPQALSCPPGPLSLDWPSASTSFFVVLSFYFALFSHGQYDTFYRVVAHAARRVQIRCRSQLFNRVIDAANFYARFLCF